MPTTNNESQIRDGTTSLLPICTVCHIRMARSGRALSQLRANPHIYDGWTHRGCRAGQPRQTPQPHIRTATATTIQPTTFNFVNITLDKEQKNQNIDLKKYDNLYIGVELEFDNLSPERAKEILGFPYQIGKTDGKNFKKIKKTTSEVTVEFNHETDLYKESDLITQIYRDGSIQSEVVLRPLPINQWGKIKEIHKKLKDAGADFYYNGHGGLHLTFLTDHHKDLSKFDPIATKNLIQFSRMFYWDIVKGFGYGGKTRQIGYRAIPRLEEMQRLYTQHYTAISLRKNGNDIFGIEVRFPDGCNDFDHILKQVKFWSAVMRQTAKISRAGLMQFPQETWDRIQSERPQYLNGSATAHGQINPQIAEILKQSLDFFGYYEQPQTAEQLAQEQTEIENLLKKEVA